MELTRLLRGRKDDPSPSPKGERAREAIEQRLFGGGQRKAAQLDRYELLEVIGKGGCAVVHRAFDPELQRDVAIKLIRAEAMFAEAEAERRLVREAHAIAKLSHTNIVPVFDVGTGVGADGDSVVFVVMEFLRGGTLAGWFKQRPPWREVVRVMAQAGRGLHHAHVGGLIHRDFKPANVLLTPERVPKVVDFGLARSEISQHDATDRPIAVESQLGPVSFDTRYTSADVVVGTPLYMAPEQFRGTTVDRRADIYAFCVALYIGLFGESPYGPRPQMRELFHAKRLGPPALPPRPMLPASLRELLTSGLEPDPANRPADMQVVVDTLEHALPRRRVALLGGLGLAVGGAVLGAAVWGPSHACEAADRADAIWDDAARSRMRAAFEATGAGYAGSSAARAERGLDDFAEQWRDARAAVCEADGSPRTEAGVVCLQRRLAELDAVVEVFAGADRDVVAHAARTVDGLPDVTACLGPDPPASAAIADPSTERSVRSLRHALAMAAALERAGRYREATTTAARVVDVARNLGDPSLLADALLRRGSALSRSGDFAAAERDLAEAHVTAAQTRDDQTAAPAVAALLEVMVASGKDADAERWVRSGEVLIARGGLSPAPKGRLLLALATGLAGLGRVDEARRKIAEAKALAIMTHNGRYGAQALATAAAIEERSGASRSALRLRESAVESYAQALGPEHPETAAAKEAVGRLQMSLGSVEAARDSFAQALTDLEAALGPDHLRTAAARAAYARSLAALGQADEAREQFAATLAVERKRGAPPGRVAATLLDLAGACEASGHAEQAERYFAEATALLGG